MNESGTLLQCAESFRLIEDIDDPVVRNLVEMAFVHFVKKVHFIKAELPKTDLDMLFVVKALKEFFSEKEVIASTLKGDKVGAWFDDRQDNPAAAFAELVKT